MPITHAATSDSECFDHILRRRKLSTHVFVPLGEDSIDSVHIRPNLQLKGDNDIHMLQLKAGRLETPPCKYWKTNGLATKHIDRHAKNLEDLAGTSSNIGRLRSNVTGSLSHRRDDEVVVKGHRLGLNNGHMGRA